jgi:hypothetical protein
MARHNSALELAYAIQINLAASEEARLQAKRDSMARWRKKHGERYPTRTTPEASAEAAKLRATPSPEGRGKAQSLEMAADTESYGDWAERVGKARDWPQCDQCDAPRAADDGKGEPIVHQGNYLCRRCASKVGKAYFVEDAVTESVLRKQSTMPLYATAGTNGSGEEGNEDDGNYSNPDERPLYQKTGAWPDELWTNTDPDDVGKQGQRAMIESEQYMLNKTRSNLRKMNDFYANGGILTHAMEAEHGSTAQPSRGGLGGGDDRGRRVGNPTGTREVAGRTTDSDQHRRGDHLDPVKDGGGRTRGDGQTRIRPSGEENPLVLGVERRELSAGVGATDHPMDDKQGRSTPDSGIAALNRSKVDNHVDDQGSTEHHRQEGDQGPGHAKDNPRSCIYCGKQDGHTLLCDRPANKAIDLSFLGPIMTEG